MNDNRSYFKKALSDFAFDAAYGDSIRHLYRKGYSLEAIKEHLNCESLSIEKISQVIDRFCDSYDSPDPSGQKNPASGAGDGSSDTSINNAHRYEYVKEYDSYGRASFIRRKIPD